MFIYCGDEEDGKIRVLDTSDMITEVVDYMQLKVAQSKGYAVKKDFRCDYAHELMNYLKTDIFVNYTPVIAGMSDVDIEYLLDKITGYSKKFNLDIDFTLLFYYTHVYWYIFQDVCALCLFSNNKEVGVLLINEFGIHQSSLQLESIFPDSVPLLDFRVLESRSIVMRLRFFSLYSYKKDVTMYFNVSKFGEIREEHSDIYGFFK